MSRYDRSTRFIIICFLFLLSTFLWKHAVFTGLNQVHKSVTQPGVDHRLPADWLSSNREQMSVYDLINISCKVRRRDYEVLLISHGGSGSTDGFNFFYEKFGMNSSALNDVSDQDGLKHNPYPTLLKTMKKCLLSAKVVIYQFADPVQAVFSLFRRGFWPEHFKKLEPRFLVEHLREQMMTNLSAYASTGKDLLGLRAHIESYLIGATHSEYPIVFLNSATRLNNGTLQKLYTVFGEFGVKMTRNYLMLSQDSNTDSQKNSVSSTRYENATGCDLLKQTYAELSSLLDNLGDVSLAYKGTLWKL